ncbi:hypothetical protein GZH47_28055 [Paenibacillus rhizovicinus]|uniref:DUF4309 domain-containing protein n=1 Tax=Paenibacillus rhizovicinus TaxID=2704463 RepID=A0A6C0P794_9BACL|nr:hypothetical protein [Paenibacillus rhizovicinus]QHW34271.1 hypothetical protein GZH47_28055 [Paenibacillus rhizovicinus]
MKPNYTKHAVHTAAVALLVLSVTGCQLSVAGVSHPAQDDDVVDVQQAYSGQESDSPQKTYNTKDKGDVIAVKDPLEDDGSATDPDATTESSTGKPAKPTPPAAKADKAWNAQAPRLIGVAIGESKSEAAAKLGKPLDSYPLEDGDAKLSVDEYAAYTVGYGSDKNVVFVEVFDKAAVTGLNGIRVGDSGRSAVKAIGKPSSQTASVISYEADGALLKLDLDPQNSRIVSIKLFSTDRQPQS